MPDPQSKPFFVCGNPKSGTTFLQRCLQLHPLVSCPSEQQFKALKEGTRAYLHQYQRILEVADRRTGGQGAPQCDIMVEAAVFRAVVEALSRSFARSRPIHGLKDNKIFEDPIYFDNLFGQPKIIAIFRDPVDVALSTWRHSQRLATAERQQARLHRAVIKNPRNSLEGFVEIAVKSYRDRADQFLDYARGRQNFMILRYESLASATGQQLARVFAFLDAATPSLTLAGIVSNSTREVMAKASRHPGFFGIGRGAVAAVSIPAEVREQLQAIWLSPQLAEIGYPGT